MLQVWKGAVIRAMSSRDSEKEPEYKTSGEQTIYNSYAGFPLTDRDLSRSFAVVSAHAPEEVDWAAHRGIDTLVLLMAGATLRESVGCMLSAGWPEATPVNRRWLRCAAVLSGILLLLRLVQWSLSWALLLAINIVFIGGEVTWLRQCLMVLHLCMWCRQSWCGVQACLIRQSGVRR